MKNLKSILFIMSAMVLFVLCPVMLFAQTETVNDPTLYENYFANFAAVVSLTAIITEAVKKWLLMNMAGEWTQRIISWLIGVIIGLFGYFFNLGMFGEILWWQSLLWGFGAGLASNGLFDTGLIEWLFKLFTKKK